MSHSRKSSSDIFFVSIGYYSIETPVNNLSSLFRQISTIDEGSIATLEKRLVESGPGVGRCVNCDRSGDSFTCLFTFLRCIRMACEFNSTMDASSTASKLITNDNAISLFRLFIK